jgi:hypothetical protein
MGETRVDLAHLLEDLRDAYPGSIEETILTEIVANSLDSGADEISFHPDHAGSTLAVTDNGSGMKRRDLARYHDIASSTKTRGEGIGFAGVGIKLALLISEEVVTETRRGKVHVASRWRLASKHKAPWKWEPPAGLVRERGTSVRMRLDSPLSPLLDPGYIEGALLRHYRPLFDPRFRGILAARYPRPIRFTIHDREVAAGADVDHGASLPDPERGSEIAAVEVRLPRKRKPSAVGYLFRAVAPIPEERAGIAISTLGKIIKNGWDWLALSPSDPTRIGGIIEVPALAECLTLNKADFIRTGPRGALFLSYRKAIQEAVTRQLTIWGNARDADEDSRRRAARPLERDLERVLVDLADQFPLLAALVERREGGQRRLPMGRTGGGGDPVAVSGATAILPGDGTRLDAHGVVGAGADAEDAGANGADAGSAGARDDATPEPPAAGEPPEPPAPPPGADARISPPPGSGGPKRPARYGLGIRFASHPDDPELGRLVDSTVYVNEAHPAYTRARASRSEGYHLALSVAMALAPLAVAPSDERAFVTAFLEGWGKAGATKGRRGQGA